jgi:benzoyl-CoA reductase/2-hydroxyglutaryl-CoA dehydratase subunit BcrC/BadD/HgdB
MGRRYPKLEAASGLNRLMEEHYVQALGRRPGRPVVWVNAGAPVELLRAMGVCAVYPENYGAMCGTRGAVPLCEVAEGLGYSRDLCSYARISIGATVAGAEAPLQGLGKPDLLVCCSNTCGTIVKWFEALARLHGAPLFVLDAPFLPDDLPPHAVTYMAQQMEDLIRWLEARTGRRLDTAELARAAQQAQEATKLWREVRYLCRARPSPLNAPDLFLHMAPIVVLRGTPEATAHYRRLRDEVAARVREGVGGIAVERYRLLWDNIAIWPRLYRFFSQFADRGACFVVDLYTGSWDMPGAAGEPLESLARAYLDNYLNRTLAYRLQRAEESIVEFACDGFVMHNNRSCKPYSLSQPVARRLLAERTGVPGLLLEADMCDTRAYADEPIRTRVEAYLETLAARAA